MDAFQDIDTLDHRLSRRRRARHQSKYQEHSRVPRELAERLLEHLDPIRCDPRRVLELGAAQGHLRRELMQRFPRAHLLSTDDCHTLLSHGHRPRWPWGRPSLVCCTAGALPLPAASVDLLICNLALLQESDVPAVLSEWHRVMRDGALLLLVSLGSLSFQELTHAWRSMDAAPHLHPYLDMHDLGDALVAAGFGDVVLDSQRLRVEFDDLVHLLRELRTLGGGNVLHDRARGLMTPRKLERLARLYASQSEGNGCWATVEAVFAHAWVQHRSGLQVAPPRLAS